MQKEEIIADLKSIIQRIFSIEESEMADFDENNPLLGQNLEIDSIDVLEIAVEIEKKYKIKIDNMEKAQEVFKDLSTIADWILANSPILS